MDTDWIHYKCKSGQTLFVYNKVTGEHKWPSGDNNGSTEGIIMQGEPVVFKEFCCTATQTDDNGCSNGCTSMYINTHHTGSTSALSTDLPQQDAENDDKFAEKQEVRPNMEEISAMLDYLEGLEFHSENNNPEATDSNIDDIQVEDRDESEPPQQLLSQDNNDNINSKASDERSDSQLCEKDDNCGDKQEKSFQCSYCEKKFTHKHSLKLHLKTHLGKTHEKNNTGVKEFGSSDSPNEKRDESKLSKRDRSYCEKLKPFRCSYCKNEFARKHHLKSHLIIHTGEKLYGCSFCEKTFARKCTLNVHLRTHTGEKPFGCGFCEKKFAQNGNLQCHLRTHTGEKPFECSYCSKKFTGKSHLTHHIMTHTGEKPFGCGFCDKKFKGRSSLKYHLMIHTGEKPIECSYCSKKFAQKSHLSTHLMTHTGEKPFECSFCDKKFLGRSNLKYHLMIHTGEKPFGCGFCDRKFRERTNLRCHLMIHTGEKPFECSYCSKKFIRKSHLERHLMTHTGKKTV